MDLNTLSDSVESTTDVPVTWDDEGQPTEGFHVVGSNSKEYQDAVRKFDVINVKRVGNRGRSPDMATDEGAKDVVLAGERRKLAIGIACVKSMYGFTNNGEPAEANNETLTTVFKKRPTWLNKVVTAVEAEGNFPEG